MKGANACKRMGGKDTCVCGKMNGDLGFECDPQEKQFGGKDCEGNDTRVQTCNSSPCPGITNFCLHVFYM